MSDLPAYEPPGAPGGWSYHPPTQPPPPPPRLARSHARRRAAVGFAAVALLAGGVGGVAGQLGTSAIQPSNASPSRVPAQGAAFASSSSLTVGEVVARLEPSVVAIEVTYGRTVGGGGGRGAGTGVILTTDGQVLTNAHVVAGATTVSVTVNGERTTRPASIVGSDSSTDLALLQISAASGLAAAPLGASGAVRVGDEVVAIGNALALEGGPTVTKGIISGLDRSLDEGTGPLSGLLQTDASISSGNSGGPLIDAAGAVIGINTAVATSSRSTSAENVGFAIAIDQARPVIEAIRSQGLPRQR